jgi:CheY-specific phosphatase CheX
MSLCIDTRTTLVDAVNTSVIQVFKMMVNEDIVVVATSDVPRSVADRKFVENALTIAMGFSGDLTGSCCVCLPQDTAIRWASLLIGHESDDIDQTVIDAASELANIIVGGIKRRLCDFDLTMSLPSVIRAGERNLVFASDSSPIVFRYMFGDCELSAVVALSQSSVC